MNTVRNSSGVRQNANKERISNGMKILIDARWIKQTGVGRYIENLITELLKIDNKNQYILLVREQDREKVHFAAPNVKIETVNIQWYSAKEQTVLLQKLNSIKPDLVHFTSFNMPLGYRGKFVITIHDLTLLRFRNIRQSFAHKYFYKLKDLGMRVILKNAIARAKTILTPTDFVKEDIASVYKVRRNKIVVTPEAAEAAYQKPRVDLARFGIDKPFLLYVGNAYPHKNLERLIIAFGKLITEYMLDYQLVIAGRKDSFHESLRQEVAQAHLENRVIFTDYVSDAELAGLYKNAALYVFPSLSEGFGLPPLEAMAYGLPVVSSAATCLPEVLGDAAVYFKPKSPSDMANVISSTLADKELQEKLVKRGYAQVKKFSWRKTAKATYEVYERVLKSSKA